MARSHGCSAASSTRSAVTPAAAASWATVETRDASSYVAPTCASSRSTVAPASPTSTRSANPEHRVNVVGDPHGAGQVEVLQVGARLQDGPRQSGPADQV